VAFEVYLEFGRFRSIIERDGDLHLPWPVLCGVRNFPGIMAAQSILQIVGETNVMARRVGLADEEVNVGELCQRTEIGLLRFQQARAEF